MIYMERTKLTWQLLIGQPLMLPIFSHKTFYQDSIEEVCAK